VLEGQLKDLSLEGTEPTEETVLDMYTKKTGYLLGLALELGAVAADMDEELRNRIGRVGHKLGVGFQIHDDLLERSADSKKLGKDTGSDRNKNKSTLVKRIGEDSARDRSRAFIDEGQTLLENFPYNTTRLQELANFLVERTY
jgi:geranylgeranyl pyrophosphate synthase